MRHSVTVKEGDRLELASAAAPLKAVMDLPVPGWWTVSIFSSPAGSSGRKSNGPGLTTVTRPGGRCGSPGSAIPTTRRQGRLGMAATPGPADSTQPLSPDVARPPGCVCRSALSPWSMSRAWAAVSDVARLSYPSRGQVGMHRQNSVSWDSSAAGELSDHAMRGGLPTAHTEPRAPGLVRRTHADRTHGHRR